MLWPITGSKYKLKGLEDQRTYIIDKVWKGAKGTVPALKPVLSQQAVRVIDCPVGYSENFKVTAKLGEMVCTL